LDKDPDGRQSAAFASAEFVDHGMIGAVVGAATSAAAGTPERISMQPRELEERIAAFPAWRYEFRFEEGLTTPTADRGIANRQAQRHRYFFRRLLDLTGGSLRGRRVLDLGCNAGFWALHAIEAGAEFVLGIDGQQRYLDQAELVFDAKAIDASKYRFERADVFAWEPGSDFDVVLCLGLLDHVAKPVELFQLIAAVDPELVVIDTEVSRARASVLELARLYDARDAIGSPLVLIPSRAAIAQLAEQHGFESVALALDITDHTAMSDYRRHRRLAFICSKSLSLERLPAEPLAGVVPWWLRDPRALLSI
jgi:tRNA (mo5U34)-methyltransferase